MSSVFPYKRSFFVVGEFILGESREELAKRGLSSLTNSRLSAYAKESDRVYSMNTCNFNEDLIPL